MINRFKGVSAALADWEGTTRIIPEEVWAIVLFLDGTIGLKIGQDKQFSETPWIVDPRTIDTKLDKQVGEGLSITKFLAEDNNYYEVTSGSDLDQILLELDERGLEIITKEEASWIRDQMYLPPVLSAFSIAGHQNQVEMGATLTGSFILTWALSNNVNIASLNIAVNAGLWNNDGNVPTPESTVARTIDLQSPLTYSQIRTVSWTLSGIDSKGDALVSRVKSTTWTHRIHWGTIAGDTITTLAEIIGSQSVLSNSRLHTVTFTPTASQKSIILIAQEVDQTDINIVNANSPSINHSYGMNDGDGGTTVAFTVTDNGIVYNAYVSYNPSDASSTAIIK